MQLIDCYLLVVAVSDPPVGQYIKMEKIVGSRVTIQNASLCVDYPITFHYFFGYREVMASKRALFTDKNAVGSSPKKKGRSDESDSKLLSVKEEKELLNGANAVEVGTIIRARYGTTNAETCVGAQACVIVCLFANEFVC